MRGVNIGRISKAIRLKLKELRIDDIFKKNILKYHGEIENEEKENLSEENTLKEHLNIDEAIEEGIENLKIETTKENNKLYKNSDENVEKQLDEEIETLQKTNYSKEYSELLDDVETNKTIMQYFEWYYSNDGSLWSKVRKSAKELSNVGITALWLPPACKAHDGINDVGYGIYDLFDLGEFDQKGTVRTKYGTKEEYIAAINEAHKNNIKIYGDVVFNHKAGADDSEIVAARPVANNNRNMFIGEARDIRAHTIFNFPRRGEKYSEYKWTSNDFDGVDFDDITKQHGIFKFEGKEWETNVDKENGNYDFLMFADLDMDSHYVVDELKRWGKWYLQQTNVDGFRLDAIKHIRFDFFKEWLDEMREFSDKDLFAVGEYWSFDVNNLKYYLDSCGNSMSLFDVPLHYNFQFASKSLGKFDMRKLTDNTLLSVNPSKTVTFVDNHDTQFGQSLESWVEPWFKPLAYTFILTRKEGYPCVFFGDYYGIPEKNFEGIKDKLDIILRVRKDYAYGIQHDYMDNNALIGWTREGNSKYKNSGLAAVITVGCGGAKKMYVGSHRRGEIWKDVTEQVKEKVVIDENGQGVFKVLDGSYSIWINED